MYEKLSLQKKVDKKQITAYLRQGKIGLFPTDTVYGVCCRVDDSGAVERIFQIKRREKEKPVLILSDTFERAKKYIKNYNIDFQKKQIIEKYWPGPLTIVFPANLKKVPSIVRAGGDTIAIRIPDKDDLREVIEELGVPIVAPSANLSGGKTFSSLARIDEKILSGVDFIVDGECTIKSASTIIDFSKDKIEILRHGALDLSL